jgi:hypothetical protein
MNYYEYPMDSFCRNLESIAQTLWLLQLQKKGEFEALLSLQL